MRMKFFRILPDICASTWCLFSNSTRNMALGRGSITVAMTSMASSLGRLIPSFSRNRCEILIAVENPQDLLCNVSDQSHAFNVMVNTHTLVKLHQGIRFILIRFKPLPNQILAVVGSAEKLVAAKIA